jgi:hypothetical protein
VTMTDPVINSHPDDIDAFVAWLKKRCCSPEQPNYDAHSASVRGTRPGRIHDCLSGGS